MSAKPRYVWALAILACGGLRAATPAPATSPARVASIQNQVETLTAGTAGWRASVLEEALRAKDHVRTGPGSRAAILYSDQTLHRMSERSEVEIQAPDGGRPGILQVLSGKHYFTSRTPRDYNRIDTPTVTAAIRGTEFTVDVSESGTTLITMIEGTVAASNEFGSVTVGAGEEAFVEPGKAPVRRVVVRPRDAVAWALYYPPVLGGSDAKRLEAMGAPGRELAHAAELLSSGQVADARPIIDAARKARPDDAVALALASVIAVADDRNDEAMSLADRAVKADANSAAAALARSFAAQARFDIATAGSEAERAAKLDPGGSTALARAAELRMAQGDLEGARRAAQDAVTRTPNDARALAVLGFVELARLRTADAENAFERAVAADSALPLAQLGLGIARFRRGRTEEALAALQTATALDPEDSLARSYLGKAYYELKRDHDAGTEFARAKTSDPQDPTPYLYDATRLQVGNRPVEALDSLLASFDRNDRRAVYRSRLLLDRDLAARGADLARIFNDLGFEQAGLVSARRSADEDQANFSSHLFLSGNYRALPGYAPAFLSEVLQARIYQPVNVNATRPDVVSETATSFNEYTALFDRPRARFFGGGSWSGTDTDLSDQIPAGDICLGPGGVPVSCLDATSIAESNGWSGDAQGSYAGDRYAVALGVTHNEDDGFRANNDRDQTNYRGFFQWAPTWQDNFQLNVISGNRKTGDLPLRELPTFLTPERFDTDETNIGLGYHRRISAASDLAVSAVYNDTEQVAGFKDVLSGTTSESTARLRGPQLEVQQVWRQPRVTWTFGAGIFDGEFRLEGATGNAIEANDRYLNGYAYAKIRGLGPVEITAGAAVERVDSPSGMLVPRDSFMQPAPIVFGDSNVSPKLGVSWFATPSTVVRAAGYYRLSPFLGRVQTLEPTQVAGFNQFFEDAGGAKSLTYGGGVDQRIGGRVFVGVSYLRRSADVPQSYCEFPDDFSACNGQQVDRVVVRNLDEDLATVYVEGAMGKRVTGVLEYSDDDRQFDYIQLSPSGLFEDRVHTRRFRPELRLILPSGLFATARGTRYDQQVDQFDDLSSPARRPVDATFWTADAAVGFRMPDRWGSVVLEVTNLTNEGYNFFLPSLQDTVIPARRATLRLNVTY